MLLNFQLGIFSLMFDGMLSYTELHSFLGLQDAKKLEQIYSDPSQRLVADCTLLDVDTAVVSDRKGSIAILSCSDRLEGTYSFCIVLEVWKFGYSFYCMDT